MTSKEAFLHQCKPGYWLENVAPLGSPPDWVERVQPQTPDNKLFGYDEKEFLQKQYR